MAPLGRSGRCRPRRRSARWRRRSNPCPSDSRRARSLPRADTPRSSGRALRIARSDAGSRCSGSLRPWKRSCSQRRRCSARRRSLVRRLPSTRRCSFRLLRSLHPWCHFQRRRRSHRRRRSSSRHFPRSRPLPDPPFPQRRSRLPLPRRRRRLPRRQSPLARRSLRFRRWLQPSRPHPLLSRLVHFG